MKTTLSGLYRFAGIAALWAAASCGGKVYSNGASPTDVPSDLVRCSNKEIPDAYAPGLSKMGQSGIFKFVLVSSNPAPPSREVNTWTVKVLDAVGNPVTDAVFAQPLKPWMPDHGHGSAVQPSITASGDAYVIDNLYFFMAGLWQVPLTVTAGGSTDSVVFSFCVSG